MAKVKKFDKAKAMEEVQNLENSIKELNNKVKVLKLKVEKENDFQKEDIEIIVTDLKKINIMVGERKDVGH